MRMSCYNHTDVISHLTIAECSYNNFSPFFAFCKITCIFSDHLPKLWGSTQVMQEAEASTKHQALPEQFSLSLQRPQLLWAPLTCGDSINPFCSASSVILLEAQGGSAELKKGCWVMAWLLGWGVGRHKTGNPNTHGDYKSTVRQKTETATQPSWWKWGCTVNDGIALCFVKKQRYELNNQMYILFIRLQVG